MKSPTQKLTDRGMDTVQTATTNHSDTVVAENLQPGTVPHILVVDDDPVFRATIKQIAKKRNLPITVCSTLKEVNATTVPMLFDVAIIDYFLDDLKEHLKGTDVAAVLESTPVILISNTEHGVEDQTPWPASVRKFINKKIGIENILNTALDYAEPPVSGND